MKNFNVGYPSISNLVPISFSSVASTSANAITFSSFFNTVAALEYSGANYLQCPLF